MDPRFILIGIGAGILSGMFGIGGGVVIVPTLIMLFGFKPHEATGTSLAALILPVGIFGTLNYYRRGDANVTAALLIALGLFLGVFLGSKIALALTGRTLQRAFAAFLVIAAVLVWRRA